MSFYFHSFFREETKRKNPQKGKNKTRKLTEKGQDQVRDVRGVGVGFHQFFGTQKLGAVVAEGDQKDAACFPFFCR